MLVFIAVIRFIYLICTLAPSGVHRIALDIEFIPLAGHHGENQTNKLPDFDGWGFSKLLSGGLRNRLFHNTDTL